MRCAPALVAVSLLLVAAPGAFAAGGTLDLATEADSTLTPGGTQAKAGAVAAVGDVNGDGVTDYAVGYPNASRLGRDNAGVVDVLFGRADGGVPGNVDAGALGDKGFEIVGGSKNRRLGRVIAGVGDVNGDGLADVAIGSPTTFITGTDPNTPQGYVWVVFGKRTTAQVDTAKSGSTNFRMWGAVGDRAGSAVGAVADLNGDQRSEIAVGAPGAAGAAGRVLIVLSRPVTSNLNLATAGAGALEIDGAAGSGAGSAVTGLPDVDGDGRPDLAIGAKTAAQGSGLAAIVHLPAPGSAAVNIGALAPGQGAVRIGPAGSAAGSSLASAGDLDGDGVADLLVGAPTASPASPPRYHAGAVYFVPGTADGTGALDTGTPWMTGDRSYDRLGWSLDAGATPGAAVVPPASAVAVGAPIVPPTDHTKAGLLLGRVLAGAAYVVFPAVAGGSTDAALPTPGAVIRLVGSTESRAGDAVAVARDGGTTSVLVGALAPQEAAAWGVRDVRPPGFPAAQGEGCARTTNLEVIVDDSGSMNTNDKQKLAQQALDLLLTKPGNLGRITGAVEFGTRARQIFAPVPAPGTSTGALHDSLAGLMSEHIVHDAGLTNFNAAFLAAGAENPAATARIFITDGFASKEGVPPFDANVVLGVPTWAIGLGSYPSSSADKRMTGITQSTGGEYFPRVTAQQLAGVVDTIDAVGLCGLRALPTSAAGTSGGTTPTLDNGVKGALPETIRVSRHRPAARFRTRLVGNPSVVDLTLTWGKRSAKFTPLPLTMVRGHRRAQVPVAKIRRALKGRTVRFRSLRIRGSRGATYATLRVAGLGGATASSVPAYAASKWDLANWGGTQKPPKKPRRHHGGNAARAAAAPVATRVSLSAYRRR